MFKLSSLIALLALAYALSSGNETHPVTASASGEQAAAIYFKPAKNVTVGEGSVWSCYPRQGYEFVLSYRDSTATIDLPGEQFTKQGLDIYQSAPGEWETLLPDGGYVRVNAKTGVSTAKIKGKNILLVPETAN